MKGDLKKLMACEILNYSQSAFFIHKGEIQKDLLRLNNKNFVYCLTDGEDIVYVGRTKRLKSRLMTHARNRRFNFIYCFEFDDKTVIDAERQVIKKTIPALNDFYLKNRIRAYKG